MRETQTKPVAASHESAAPSRAELEQLTRDVVDHFDTTLAGLDKPDAFLTELRLTEDGTREATRREAFPSLKGNVVREITTFAIDADGMISRQTSRENGATRGEVINESDTPEDATTQAEYLDAMRDIIDQAGSGERTLPVSEIARRKFGSVTVVARDRLETAVDRVRGWFE